MALNVIIKRIDAQLEAIIREDLPILKKVKRFVIQSGGKRIRPLTHYYFTAMLGAKSAQWVDVAAIGELIHAASLLHDDVIDESNLRRGRATVNASHGNKEAILSGDYLLACGLDHLRTLENALDLLSVFTRVIRMLAVGELVQEEWEGRHKIPEAKYEQIILGKTGSLFGAMTEAAAIHAGKSGKERERYRLFGERMGRLFQIRDDYLDYFGEASANGKTLYQDYSRGLMTYPSIKLRGLLGVKGKRALEKLWAGQADRSGKESIEQFLQLAHDAKLQRKLAADIETCVHELMSFVRGHAHSEYREDILKQLNALLVPIV